jgi:hypothetical protein
VTAPLFRKVVLAPNLIGAALIDPAARRVLEAWRDGKFMVVMNRDLIAVHLRALNRVVLAPELIKRWAYWLSSPEKTIFLEKQFAASASPINLCEELANAAKADAIICWKLPSAKYGSPWLPAEDFLRS